MLHYLGDNHPSTKSDKETVSKAVSVDFPHLVGSTALSASQLEDLKARLYSDSVDMMFKFQNLFSSLKRSIRLQKISLKDVVSEICAIGSFLPVYKRTQQPVLREQLPKLQAAESIEDIMLIINDYCSFFNYEIIEHLIQELGTEEDKQCLQEYISDFKCYAERKVFECPPEVGAQTKEGMIRLVVKLDSAYDDCTLNHLHVFKNKLCKILGLANNGTLKLCHTDKGCIQMTFQILDFLPPAVFPMSQQQKESLIDLKVHWLKCGEYKFEQVSCKYNY